MADILSQEEVDLLLSAVSDGDIARAEKPADTGRDLHMIAYDFRRPERVSKEQLKGLQSLFEAFAREVSILLPPYLRTIVRVDLTSIDQLTYDEFILSVARPTALSIIDMSPLEGTAVLELSPSMVFPIVDRVLGGRGMALAEPRELTEIENRIVQCIDTMILDSLKRSWEQLIEFDLSVMQQESDPLIVQIVAGSEMVVLVGYEIHLGESVGTMNFCIPLLVLNPVLDQISQQVHYIRRMSPEQARTTQEVLMRTMIKAVSPVDAVLGTVKLSLNDINQLHEGDIIPLDSSIHDPVLITVGGIPQFAAKRGRRREQSAVQLLAFAAE